MKKILISQTCKSNVAKFYAYENQVEYSSIYMRIYATKKTDIFLLHVSLDCEGQCDKEGNSFWTFETYDELIHFLLSDTDMRTHFPKENVVDIHKIYKDNWWYI